MAWAEPQPGGGFRGRYRTPDGEKHTVLRPDGTAWPKKKEAKDAATEEEVLAKRKPAPKKSSGRYPASITWGEWWDILCRERTFEMTATGITEGYIVGKHIRPYWGLVPMNAICTRDPDSGQVGVQEWVDGNPGLKTRPGMSIGYANRVYSVFSASMNRAVGPVLESSPTRGVKLPRIPKRKRNHATPTKINALNIRSDYKDVLMFGTETGLRPGEICGLHAMSIDKAAGFATVETVFVSKLDIIRHYPKDGDHRDVPLTPRAMEIALRRMQGRDLGIKCPWPHVDGKCSGSLLFMTERGRPFKPRSAYTVIENASARSNVPTLSGMYSTRHGFGTRAANGGMNLFEVADIMGHEDLKITRGYFQGSKQVRRRLTEALDGDD